MKVLAALLLLPLLLSTYLVRAATVCGSGVVGPRCNVSLCQQDGCSEELCVSTGRCPCPAGWTGALCDAPVCAPGCSTEHGYCGEPGECRCEVGWWGERCDLCFPYPGCKHGTCKQPWQCLCQPDWSGNLCDTREAPEGYKKTKEDSGAAAGVLCGCLNGGTCMEAHPPHNYTCSCPALFTGRHCDYSARSLSPRMLLSGPRTPPTSEEQEQKDEAEEEDPKNTRRRLLQKHARISFRPSKPGSGAGNRSRQSTPPPYVVGNRKLLPLPVVLPRVSEMVSPAFNPNRKHKSVSKQRLYAGLTTGSVQGSTRKNSIPNARGGHLPARPRLVQVLNSQRRPILVSLPATLLTAPSTLPPTTPAPSSPILPETRPSSLDRGSTPSTLLFYGVARPYASEPRGPINLYPRKITTPPPPTTKLPVAATTSSSSSNNNASTITTTTITSRKWPKVALWPPIRRQGAIRRRHPVQGPSARSDVVLGTLIRRAHTTAAERHKASGTERLETLQIFPREFDSQSALSQQIVSVGTLSDFEDIHIPKAKENADMYYEQNADGRVHIGDVSRVDSAPAREIMDAFIELKKV